MAKRKWTSGSPQNAKSVFMESLEGRQLLASTTFDVATNLVANFAPEDVAVADLNGDGKLDIAGVGNSTLSVFLQSPDRPGEFQLPISVSLQNSSHSLSISDWNGDGRPDIHLAERFGDRIFQVLNQGNGTFGSATELTRFSPLGFGSNRRILVANLTTGDARPDIIVTHDDGRVFVKTRTASDTLNPELRFTITGSNTTISDLKAGDVDADGDLDLVVAAAGSASSTLFVYPNDGTANFAAATPVHVATTPDVSAIAVGDFNGDGRADLASVGYDSAGTLRTHRSFVSGSSLAFQGLLDQPLRYGSGVVLADVDVDGDVDVVASGQNLLGERVISVFRSNGDAAIVSREEYPAEMGRLAVGNIDGDLAPDVIGASTFTTGSIDGVSLAFNYGNGSFAGLPLLTPRNTTTGQSLVTSDVDQDGDDDVITISADSGNTVQLHRNLGGYFKLPENLSPSQGVAIGRVAVGDVNGDSFPDIAMMDEQFDRLYVRLGNAQRTFGASTLALQSAGQVGRDDFVLADMNSDGRADAVYEVSLTSIAVAFGTANGTFLAEQVFGAGGSGVLGFSVGDINGDGHRDVVIAEGSQMSVLRNPGNGTLIAGAQRFVVPMASFTSNVRIAQMIGGSGTALEIAYSSSGGLGYLNNSSNSQSLSFSPSTNQLSGFWGEFTTADFDGDGDEDLVTQYSNAQLRPVRNDSTGGLIPLPLIGSGSGSASFGRIDRGGTPDLVSLRGASGFETLFNIGNGSFAATTRQVVYDGNGFSKILSAELTGDAHPDVVGLTFNNQVMRLRNNGSDLLYDRIDNTGTTDAVDFAIGNFDGSSRNDILVLDGNSTNRRLNLLVANAEGGYSAAETRWTADSGGAGAFTRLVTGDVDRDGFLDALVLQPSQNRIYVLRFDPIQRVFTTIGSFSTGPNAVAFLLADLDNDNDLDAAVTGGNDEGIVSYHFNNAPGLSLGTFTDYAPQASFTGLHYPATIAASDLTGDGKIDLAVGTSNAPFNLSGVVVLKNTTTGGVVAFSGIAGIVASYQTNARPSLSLTDVDADGRIDIVAGRETATTIFRNLPGGEGAVFRDAQTIMTPGEFITPFNFNNDGIADFVGLDGNGLPTLRLSLSRSETTLSSILVSDNPSSTYNNRLRATFRVANAQFLLYSSLGNGDFVLAGPGGFWQPGTFIGASVQRDNSMLITYDFPARLGAWDSTDNGGYSLRLIGASLQQPGGRTFPDSTQTIWANNLWFNAPTAERVSESVADAGASMDIAVRFTDAAGANLGISWSSITDGDVVLEREVPIGGGSVVVASITGTLVSRAPTGTGQLTATYRFAAPGGYWDHSDNGQWKAKIVAGQVFDNNGNLVAPLTLRSYNLFFASPNARVASFVAANGASTVTVAMEYQALGTTLMDPSTFSTGDIELRGPGNYSALGTYLGFGSTVTGGRTLYSVSYSFPAPGGVWSQTNQGQYSVWTRASQVRDASSRLVPALALDMAPIAKVSSFVANPGAATATITVDYQALGTPFMSWASFGSGDIELRGPNGFVSVATMTSRSPLQINGAWVYRVVYSLAAPGGSWNSADNGNYSVWIRSGQVLDGSGRLVPAVSIDARTLFF